MNLVSSAKSINFSKILERKSHSYHVRKILQLSESATPISQSLDLGPLPDLVSAAQKYREKNGYFPVSFGVMVPSELPISITKSNFISPIIPGLPYSFDDASDYYSTYNKSWWGITHKKGGWDCLRHIEIIDSGAVPLMYDAWKIPEGAMFFYPKKLMSDLYQIFKKQTFTVDIKVLEYLATWKNEFLTSEAIIRNSLSAIVNHQSIDRVLFIDPDLNRKPDYLSLMVIYGLERLFPNKVDIYSEAPEYIFDDYAKKTDSLYGKGFGFTKGVPSVQRSVVPEADCEWRKYSLIIVGHGLRNIDLLEQLKGSIKREQLMIFEGGDNPIGALDLVKLLSFTPNVFIREGHR